MKTVNEVSRLTGVSIRTLHYYDKIGLLKPASKTNSGYRLYDDTALEKLQHILLFRELEFPLKDIKGILDNPDFDRDKALRQQIALLTLQKEHLENLIDFARGIKLTGGYKMDFSVFDTKKIDEYAEQAKKAWGHTAAYKEFEEKSKNRSKDETQRITNELMLLFTEFGRLASQKPSSEKAQLQVKKLKDYISEHFYACTNEILSGLAELYAGGGSMTENIDKAGGKGTAAFTARAIKVYCKNETP